MANLVWGKAQQLCFADDHEYYRALGSLCHEGAYTITFETNSQTDSWGDAFRIRCLKADSQVPDAFIRAIRNARRINCNDYVQSLYECHDFDFDVAHKVLNGNFDKVKRTVPTSYYDDFEEGYNLRFTRNTKGTAQAISQAIQKNTIKKSTTRTFQNIKKGDIVIHKTFGEGHMIKIKDGLIYINFRTGERSFCYPAGFTSGFLTMKE